MPGLRGFDEEDLDRLRVARAWAGLCAEAPIGRTVLPAGATPENGDLVTRHCDFSHVGLLLFPSEVENALESLEALGFTTARKTSGRFVRRRIAERYRLTEARLDVRLVQLHGLRLYLLPRTCLLLTDQMVAIERARDFEHHVGVRLRNCDAVVVEGLLHQFAHEGLWFEGAASSDSETAMYFAAQGDHGGRPHRVELLCAGDHSALARRHEIDVELLSTAYRGCVGGI